MCWRAGASELLRLVSASDSIRRAAGRGGAKQLAEVSSCRSNMVFRNNLAHLNANDCKRKVFLPGFIFACC